MATEIVLDPEKEYEIVEGEPEEKIMAGARRGGVGTRLLLSLGWHVAKQKLGAIFTGGDELACEDLFAGLRLRLAEIFRLNP